MNSPSDKPFFVGEVMHTREGTVEQITANEGELFVVCSDCGNPEFLIITDDNHMIIKIACGQCKKPVEVHG